MAGEAGEQIDNAAEDADYAAAFAPEQEQTKTPADEPGEGGATEGASAAAEPVEPPPKLAEITEAQYQDLLQRAGAIDEHKRQIDKAHGQIGGLKQIVDRLQAGAGAPVEITPADLAELGEVYPEVAELAAKGLSKVLGRMRGGAPGVPVDVESLTTGVTKTRGEVLDTTLDGVVDGDWRAVVATPEFNTWKAAQTDEVKALGNSDSIRDAARMLRLYQKAGVVAPAATPAPAPAATPAAPAKQPTSIRQRQLAGAVAPRGVGGPPPAPSSDDEYMAGLNSSR